MKTTDHSSFLSNGVVPLSEEGDSPTRTRYASARALIANVFLPFLVVRLLLLLVGLVTIFYVYPLMNRKQPPFPDMLYLMWMRFDSGFYLSIASSGYAGVNTLHGQSNWGFFPLYPLVIRLVALPFGTAWYALVGVIISNIAALVAVFYLYKLTTKEFNSAIAARATFYLALFPMSFYLSAVYPESLFLALSIGCIYYARMRCWWLAGLLGALATLTRPAGALLFIALAWEYWNVLGETYAPLRSASGLVTFVGEWLRSRFVGLWRSLFTWRTWGGFVALALVLVALPLFMVYAKWKVGAYKAYFITQQYGWNHSASNPLLLVWGMLQHPNPASPWDWNFYSLNMASTLIFICLLVPVFRKLPAIYGIVMLAFLVLPLTTGRMASVTRYDLTLFPVYMLLAWWSSQGKQEQQLRRHELIAVSFGMLLSLGMVLFTLSVYSMA